MIESPQISSHKVMGSLGISHWKLSPGSSAKLNIGMQAKRTFLSMPAIFKRDQISSNLDATKCVGENLCGKFPRKTGQIGWI